MPDRISVWVTDFGRKFFQAQWIDPKTGKTRTKSTKCTRRREAERWAKEWKDKLNARHTLPADGLLSWADFVVLYGEQHLSGLSRGGADRSIGCLHSFERLASPRKIGDVDAQMISDYIQKLRSEGRQEATLAIHVRSLGAALRWASRQGYLPFVPALPTIPRAIAKRSKGRPLSGLEFRRLLRAVPGKVPDPHVDDWRRVKSAR